VRSGGEWRETRGLNAPWQDLIAALNAKRSKPDASLFQYMFSQKDHIYPGEFCS
jgi:hypothetical protein